MKLIKEATITAKLVKELRGIDGTWVKKRHQGAFGAGEPDILMVWKGHSFFIEVKRIDGELTPLQAMTLDAVAKAGAFTAVFVWDAALKEFTTWSNRIDWMRHRGTVRHFDYLLSESVRLDTEALEGFLLRKGWSL